MDVFKFFRPHSMTIGYFPSVRVSFYQFYFCQLHMYWDFECNAMDFLQDYQSVLFIFSLGRISLLDTG